MNIKQWSKYERIWLISFTLIILSITVVFSASNTDYGNIQSVILNWVISPISALSGIVCAILAAKGKISSCIWGIVYAASYAYIAYMGGYYGDMINVVWIIPMRIIAYMHWKKTLKQGSKTDVKMRKMTLKQIFIIFIIGIAGIILFGLLLEKTDHWFIDVMQRNKSIYQYFESVFGVKYLGSMIDASTEILQIVASILFTLAFAEQWLVWTTTNVISIGMWVVVIIANPSSISWALPTLIMWIAYLVNSIYGYGNWLKGASTNID